MNNIYFVSVKGNINKFLLNCNVNLLSIKYISNKEIIIKIYKEDYIKLKKLYKYKFKILNKYGLEELLFLFKKYSIFIISFVLGVAILLVLSNIIFDIDINLENKELKNTITKELENYGLEKYKFKKNYKDNNKIKNILKEKYKDQIEWIEITNNGTKVIINIIERKIDNKKTNKEYYSVVAKKSGFIKKIDVINGIKVIDENNYVNKGDIIISSDIYLNEDLKGKVSASGKVYATVWYKVICEYPLNYKEKEYTGKKRRIIFLKIGNRYLDLFTYKKFDRKEIYSIKDKLTGITIGIEEIEKINIRNKKYNNKKVIELAKKKSEEKIKEKLSQDEYIISQKTLNFNTNGSKIILEMFFSVYEEISEKRVIEENNNG